MIAPYVTINTRPEFVKNKTGFGYMVYDIAKSVGAKVSVEVLCTDSRGADFTIEGVTYLKRSFPLFIINLFRCVSIRILLQLLLKYRMSWGAFIRLVYYWMMSGYLVRLLDIGNYDIVHIHGCIFPTELWMQVCKKCHQKYVVTLHGLNSFSDSVKLEPAGKQYERDFLKRVTDGEFPITVISTGMKRLIENTYGVKDCGNITVVCNSFSFSEGSGGGKK